jgi:hypothetical protein
MEERGRPPGKKKKSEKNSSSGTGKGNELLSEEILAGNGIENDLENIIDPKTILRLKLKMNDGILEEDLNNLLEMPSYRDATPQKIANILAQSPVLEARWTVLFNQAQFEYEQTKTEFEIWKGNASEKIRNDFSQTSERATDKKIESQITLLKQYKTYNTRINRLKRNMGHIKAAASAFASRGEKAIPIAYLLKKEMGMNDKVF